MGLHLCWYPRITCVILKINPTSTESLRHVSNAMVGSRRCLHTEFYHLMITVGSFNSFVFFYNWGNIFLKHEIIDDIVYLSNPAELHICLKYQINHALDHHRLLLTPHFWTKIHHKSPRTVRPPACSLVSTSLPSLPATGVSWSRTGGVRGKDDETWNMWFSGTKVGKTIINHRLNHNFYRWYKPFPNSNLLYCFTRIIYMDLYSSHCSPSAWLITMQHFWLFITIQHVLYISLWELCFPVGLTWPWPLHQPSGHNWFTRFTQHIAAWEDRLGTTRSLDCSTWESFESTEGCKKRAGRQVCERFKYTYMILYEMKWPLMEYQSK